MKIDTLIKFGSLAFNVAQDEKLRELLKIAHNGAKRRGLYARPPIYPSPPGQPPHYSYPHWPHHQW